MLFLRKKLFTLIELLAVPGVAKSNAKATVSGEAVRRQKRSIKFTLIELLVVIAIISVLMTMLLPALRMTKLRSMDIVCKSNLKQVGIVGTSYANDWNFWMPDFYDPVAGKCWGESMKDMGYFPEQIQYKASFLFCPLQRPKVFSSYGGTYGIHVTTGYTTVNIVKLDPTRKPLMNSPSKFPVFADSRYVTMTHSSHTSVYYFTSGVAATRAVHLRHFNQVNMSFADGSTQDLDVNNLVDLGFQSYIDAPPDT